MTTVEQADSAVGTRAAERRRLGVPAITFMIVAASAPLTVLAGGVTTTFAVTGVVGVPLSFLILGATLAVFAVGYAAMSRYVTNAGAFYAYVSQGLGRPPGVGASIVALVSYNGMQIGIYGMLGYQVSSLLDQKFGVTVPWWLSVLVCIAIIAVLGVNRVDLSAKVLATLVVLEFVVVIIYDVVGFVVAPQGVSAEPLRPSSLFVPGIGAVFAFGIAAFMGFEGAAIYGEEAKDPKRTVARATYTAVGVIAIFYALSSWAMTVASGHSHVVSDSAKQGPDVIFSFIAGHVGIVVSDIAQLLFITSLFAALVSFHNSVARYGFSLGREGVLPSWFGQIRRRTGAPWAGSVAQTALAVVVIIAFAIAGAGWTPPAGSPAYLFPVLTLFSWLCNTAAMGLVLLMAVVSFAVIGFFRRNRRGVGAWARVIAPVVAAVALLAVFALIVIYFNTLLTSDPTAPPTATTFILPAIVIVPGLVGVAWGAALKRRNPRVYAQIGHGTEGAGVEELGEAEFGPADPGAEGGRAESDPGAPAERPRATARSK